MKPVLLYRGMSLRAAIRAAQAMGCKVERGHEGGEIRFSHPLLTGDRCVSHSQRQDASVTLVKWLRRVLGARQVEAVVELAEGVR